MSGKAEPATRSGALYGASSGYALPAMALPSRAGPPMLPDTAGPSEPRRHPEPDAVLGPGAWPGPRAGVGALAPPALEQQLQRADVAGARLERRYDRLLAEAMAFPRLREGRPSLPPLSPPGRCRTPKRRKGHHLALRLHEPRDAALRFLADPDVPFTNNKAHADNRIMLRSGLNPLHPLTAGPDLSA